MSESSTTLEDLVPLEQDGAAVAEAEEPTMEQKLEFLITNANAFFLIVNGIIVFFMQGGFAFLEAGSVRYE